MTTRDRVVDLAIRAFPRRWRKVNEAELLHVHEELGGSTSIRELVDLVRGGLRVRMADRPPLGIWFRYSFQGSPVPPRWHGWMHDQLTSRWFPLVSTLVFDLYLVLFVVAPQFFFSDRRHLVPQVFFFACFSVFTLLFSPWKQRRLQRQISAKIGYDITTDEWRSAIGSHPSTTTRRVQLTPTMRVAIDAYGRPVGAWSMAAGLALIVGAARSNTAIVDLRLATISPDPASPLSSTQVWLALTTTLAVVLVSSFAWRWYLVRRTTQLSPRSVHPLNGRVSQRLFWAITSVPGAAVVVVGLIGQPPDQACVAFGAALSVLGSLLLMSDHIARDSEQRIGRPVSMADLLFGERPVPMPPAPRVEDRIS